MPDYYEIVQEPIDLRMILDRINAGDYYVTLEARIDADDVRRVVSHADTASMRAQIFAADFRRLFNNCRHYNAPDTPYFKCANRLESFFEQKVR